MRFILGALTAIAVLFAGAVALTALSTPAAGPKQAAIVPAPAPVAAEAQAPATPPVVAKAQAPEKTPVAPAKPAAVIQASFVAAPALDAPAAIAPQAAMIAPIAAQPKLQGLTFLAAVEDSSPQPPVADTTPADPVEVLYVSGARVNMRSGPGSRYKWVATLPRGAQLMVVEKGDRWHKVSGIYEGTVVRGWMASGFLTPEPIVFEAAASE